MIWLAIGIIVLAIAGAICFFLIEASLNADAVLYGHVSPPGKSRVRISWPNGGPQIVIRVLGVVVSAGWPTDYGMTPWWYKGWDQMWWLKKERHGSMLLR